jgi:hypothetical protein
MVTLMIIANGGTAAHHANGDRADRNDSVATWTD